jgi:hypothetical protein
MKAARVIPTRKDWQELRAQLAPQPAAAVYFNDPAIDSESQIRNDVVPAIRDLLTVRRRLMWLRRRAETVEGYAINDLLYLLGQQLEPLLDNVRRFAKMGRVSAPGPRVRMAESRPNDGGVE